MFEKELKELGLTDNEIKVYLSLLSNGILNPTKLAEKTGLHRSYIYDTLERLIEKGIINTVLVDNKKHYQPIDPKSLRETFELKLKNFDSILPQLSSFFKSSKSETNVQLHRGKRVYKTLIKDVLANIKKNDIIYILGADETKLEAIEPIYLEQYLNTIKSKKIKEKIIIAKGNKKFPRSNLEYKDIDPKNLDETTVVIYQSKVNIFIWGEPYYLITIESEKVANTYKKQFELIWKIAKD